ncbi:hypothetical protein G7Y89_g9005 [Cudoniella acicularis]|uniref:Uncharacterized protein n=1 Tax=Cudoniella acicularis TaxID=354080 RepID=A0A8H4RFI1_9HELO|nr:hypothetical protein G7Y89_g9005 [Cudoniella acicularis]
MAKPALLPYQSASRPKKPTKKSKTSTTTPSSSSLPQPPFTIFEDNTATPLLPPLTIQSLADQKALKDRWPKLAAGMQVQYSEWTYTIQVITWFLPLLTQIEMHLPHLASPKRKRLEEIKEECEWKRIGNWEEMIFLSQVIQGRGYEKTEEDFEILAERWTVRDAGLAREMCGLVGWVWRADKFLRNEWGVEDLVVVEQVVNKEEYRVMKTCWLEVMEKHVWCEDDDDFDWEWFQIKFVKDISQVLDQCFNWEEPAVYEEWKKTYGGQRDALTDIGEYLENRIWEI